MSDTPAWMHPTNKYQIIQNLYYLKFHWVLSNIIPVLFCDGHTLDGPEPK